MTDIARVHFDGDAENCVAEISGEIDISNIREIQGLLDEHAADTSTLIVDLTDTIFLDSAGVAMLLETSERLRVTRRGFYVVIPSDAPIRRIVELSGLEGHVAIVAARSDIANATD